MDRNELVKTYDVDEGGRITSPGKFEGEMIYVPYFWDHVLNGSWDNDFEDGSVMIKITAEDQATFPNELSFEDVNREIYLHEAQDGFVYGKIQ